MITSSAAARLGSPNEFVDYAASKGATDTLTMGLAKELGPHGVRVNAVRPGLIETDIHASAGAPDRVERLMGGVPMGRAGSAEEVAKAIVWLAGDGEVTHPRTNAPASLVVPVTGPLDVAAGADRRGAFADWLTSEKNPFFAKMTVNRLWARFFGRGIVDNAIY